LTIVEAPVGATVPSQPALGQQRDDLGFSERGAHAADLQVAMVAQGQGRQLESLYYLPFGKFEHLTPAGPAAQVAEALAPYRAAGAEYLTLVPAAASPEAGVEHAAAVRAALGDVG
jgi:hypothetical protein